jgi:hypothetical protein
MRESEPLVTRGVVVAFVAAVLALGAAFGLPLTVEQKTAILGFTAVAAPVVVAVWSRGKVTPSE